MIKAVNNSEMSFNLYETTQLSMAGAGCPYGFAFLVVKWLLSLSTM